MAKVGRPLNFTPEELEQSIQKYLVHCEETDAVISQKGFCIFSDITHEWLTQNKDVPEFCLSIKKLKHICELYLQDKGLKNEVNPTMAIFLLKNNHGYKDKQEVESTSTNVNLDLNAKDLKEEIRKARKDKNDR